MTDWDEYLDIQNGLHPWRSLSHETQGRYIINGRDLSHWVHIDVLFQAYFHAMLILVDAKAPTKSSNPYFKSQTQEGFGTFGDPHIATLVAECATRALKAVWFQKWHSIAGFVQKPSVPEWIATFAGLQLIRCIAICSSLPF